VLADNAQSHALGIDLGTSGCRALVIDADGNPVAGAEQPLPASRRQVGLLCQWPGDWWSAIDRCLLAIAAQIPVAQVRTISVDSTSGTLLLTDAQGTPTTPAIMYNDQRPAAIAKQIAALSGPCAAASVSSSLAKLLWLVQTGKTQGASHALHAADWISGRLTGIFGHSDDHNALKSGFDPISRTWPQWLTGLDIDPKLLPIVGHPGSPLASIDPGIAVRYGFDPGLRVHRGTTDSIAAFLATGAGRPGDAVTVLGTTLVVKTLSTVPVVAPEYGVYSHRLGPYWLVGGASNTGGGALARYLSLDELQRLSEQLAPDQETPLDYYPLPATGERFPVADPAMASRVEPVPADRVELLHGLLEGIARIEKAAYDLLARLGATPVRRLYSAGGGAANKAWHAIRQRVLGVEFAAARHTQAAYGAACLAQQSCAAFPSGWNSTSGA